MPASPSTLIDKTIASLEDWRGETFARIRKVIHEAYPDIAEEWKWMGTPARNRSVAFADAHEDKVTLALFQGASLPDPDKPFIAGLEGNQRRAIDFHEGDKISEPALKKLIRAAVARNTKRSKK